MRKLKIFCVVLLVCLICLCGCSNSNNDELQKKMDELQKQNEQLNEKLEELNKVLTPTPTPAENPHEHVWQQKVITVATCTTEGYSVETCECGEKRNESVLPFVEHTWASKESKATCTEEGFI